MNVKLQSGCSYWFCLSWLLAGNNSSVNYYNRCRLSDEWFLCLIAQAQCSAIDLSIIVVIVVVLAGCTIDHNTASVVEFNQTSLILLVLHVVMLILTIIYLMIRPRLNVKMRNHNLLKLTSANVKIVISFFNKKRIYFNLIFFF